MYIQPGPPWNPVAMPLVGLMLLTAELLVPGYLTVRLLRSRSPDWQNLSPGECVFVSLMTGFLLISWLSITLLEIGLFTKALLGGLVALFCIVTGAIIRILPPPPPLSGGWRSVAPILLVAAVLPAYRPFEHVLGGRDPGVYVSAGLILARDGGVPFRDPIVDDLSEASRSLFLGDYSSHGIITTERFQGFWYPHKPLQGIVPQGMHLLPAWVAIASWVCGYPGVHWVTPFLALLSAMSVYYLMQRFAGEFGAVVATILFLISSIQVFFSRYPTSEILVQLLLWSSLCFFQRFSTSAGRAAALLAGLGAGLALQARIDSLLLVVPVTLVAVCYFLLLPEKKNVIYFLAAFFVPLLQAALHLFLISRPYVLSVINNLKLDSVLGEIALPGFVVAVMLAYVIRARLRRSVRATAESAWISIPLPVCVAAAAWFAWFYRPGHPRGQWDLGNANSFLYYSHYLGLFATTFFVAALMYFVHGLKGRNIFLTFLVMTYFGFYFYRLQIYPELMWATRRFIPVIWPATFVLIGLLTARFWEARRWWLRSAAVIAVGLIAWETARAAPAYFRLLEYDGAVAWVDRVARLFGDKDVLLFEPRFSNTLQTLSPPLWAIHQKNVFQFVFEDQSGAAIEGFMDEWRRKHGGRVLVALQRGIEIASLRCRPRLIYQETVELPNAAEPQPNRLRLRRA